MSALYNQIKELYSYADTPVRRVPTGIAPIDELMKGPAPGEVAVICGRSYSGKSMFGQNIIYHNKGTPSIFFSMEMPYVQALIRLYAIENNIDATLVQDQVEEGNPPADLWNLAEIYTQHQIIDESGITLDEMSDAMTRFETNTGVRPVFVVVDYLELLGGAKQSAEGFLAVEAQVTQLKDWARDERTSVFALHQANRQEPKWKPITEDSARYAGYTEADFFIGMWRRHFNPELDYYEKKAAQQYVTMNLLKNRAFFKETEKPLDIYITSSLRLGRYDDEEHERDAETSQIRATEPRGDVSPF